MNKENTFFTKDVYDTEIGLHVNSDVLERIYGRSNVTPETNLPIEFFYVSDQEEKLKGLGLHLLTHFPEYTDSKFSHTTTITNYQVPRISLKWTWQR